jgi:hypothetical protein
MITTFLRSSLITTKNVCEARALIEYSLGRRGDTNAGALIGSIVHGVLECLALEKLAIQNGENEFVQEQLGVTPAGNFDYESYLRCIYPILSAENPGIFERDKFDECLELIKKALTFSKGTFNPINCDVWAVEYPFDIELKDKWAQFDYDTPHGKLIGGLKLKGTSDLLIREDETTLHCIDYKTSKSLQDWGSGKIKTEKNLYDDPQLKFYYYALSKCFPQIENILITIYFIRLDTPFTLIFEKSTHLKEIERWIRAEFEELKTIERPKFIIDSADRYIKNQWGKLTDKCKYCPHYNNLESGTSQSVCSFFKQKLSVDGYDKTMENFCDWDSLTKYGAGASIKDRD